MSVGSSSQGPLHSHSSHLTACGLDHKQTLTIQSLYQRQGQGIQASATLHLLLKQRVTWPLLGLNRRRLAQTLACKPLVQEIL